MPSPTRWPRPASASAAATTLTATFMARWSDAVPIHVPCSGNRLARLAHDRNPHEVLIPDNAARWIEVHPAWSGNIDLNPGMCISARETIVIIVIGKT